MAHKLLLADDSVTIQRVIELTFSGEDVSVVAVGDGEQAIARIPAERPDIVLADIGMPKRSGYDVAAFVKGRSDLQHIPVLLLAGAFEPVDDRRAEQVGSDGVLVKPFEPQHVIARVRELLGGAKAKPVQAGAGASRPAEVLPRLMEAEPPAPLPVSPAGVSAADRPLDDYFDRLDAAISTRGRSPAPAPTDTEEPELEVPTIQQLLSAPRQPGAPVDAPLRQTPVTLTPLPQPIATPPVEPADSPSTLAPSAPASASATTLADAFSALLAVEAGEPGAQPLRLSIAPERLVVTDAVVQEVTRRVLQRLAPDAARAAVAEIVSEIAERLVREEIARIRGK